MLVRDRFTWFSYLMVAYYGYIQGSLGPLTPFLRDELRLNYTVAGFHLSAFALGIVLAGLAGDRLVRRFGRRRVVWFGATMMSLGVVILMAGQAAVVTVPGALVIGLFGGFSVIIIQAAVVDQHPMHRSVVLLEITIGLGVSAGFAPLLIGGMQSVGIGWRGALLAGILAFGVLVLVFRNLHIPVARKPPERDATQPSARLPGGFWAYWGVGVLVAASQWCIGFWGADFMDVVVGLETSLAAALMSAFFVAVVLGRFVASRLARRFTSGRLLLIAAICTTFSFPVFWLSPVAPLNVLGLFLTGFFIANLFPLSLSCGMTAAPEMSDAVSARFASGSGAAVLIMPQLLGSVADVVGIRNAYALVIVLLLLLTLGVVLANRTVYSSKPALRLL